MNPSRGTMRRAKRKQIQQQQAELDAMDSLPWISSDDIDEGFPMLEEIDEAAYGLAIPEPLLDFKDNKDKTKSKKRKHDQVASSAEKDTSTSDNDDDAKDKGEKIEHVDVQEDQDKGEGLSSTKKMDAKNKKKKSKAKKRKHDNVAAAASEKETSTSSNNDGAKDDGEKIEHVDVQEGQDKGEGLSSTKKMDTKKKKKKKSKAKKQKHDQVASAADKETSSSDNSGDARDRGDKVEHVDVQEEQDKGEGLSSTRIIDSKKKKKKKKKTKAKETPEIDESTADGDDGIEQVCVDEDDYYAWNELRLHPLIMRSIYRLGFKEPTAIQKSCIPAAAHQGKDVFGAAETGSGKTLAFGLPILQRLLEEREKAVNMFEENEEKAEKVAPKGFLRALIITPTRELACQVSDHLKAVAKDTGISVIPIVGGMSAQKQERLLKLRPEIVVGTPGRLWELMDGGEKHLVELHSLSFFVLDEADRMIENGHFDQLQLIIDKLPVRNIHIENEQDGVTMPSFQRKKRQTFVLSATIALSTDFRKKLKRSSQKTKQSWPDAINSLEALSERAGMRDNVAIIDLTNTSIMANKLEESFIECREEDKDAYLYYILSVHGQGRTIIFCTSVAALRHITSLLRILGTNVLTLHAQMHQRSRLKAMDRFRGTEHGKLVATDVAARGLDIPGVRTVIHYQLPHSAEVYVHRSGRTARATADGCSIALIAPNETSKFASLCKSFSKASFQGFPLDRSYLPEIMRRLSLARQIDKIMRKDSKDEAQKSWYEKNAESIELMVDDDEDEDDKVKNHKRKKATSMNLIKLQQELKMLLSRPLQPKSFSHRYLTGAGITPLVQNQLEELAKQKLDDSSNSRKKSKLVVIGQNCVEPLQALRSSGQEVHIDVKGAAEKRRVMENLRRKKKDQKKCLRDQRRKKKKQMKGGE